MIFKHCECSSGAAGDGIYCSSFYHRLVLVLGVQLEEQSYYILLVRNMVYCTYVQSGIQYTHWVEKDFINSYYAHYRSLDYSSAHATKRQNFLFFSKALQFQDPSYNCDLVCAQILLWRCLLHYYCGGEEGRAQGNIMTLCKRGPLGYFVLHQDDECCCKKIIFALFFFP